MGSVPARPDKPRQNDNNNNNNNGSKTWNSLASYKGDFEGYLRCLNIRTASTMLAQEVSLEHQRESRWSTWLKFTVLTVWMKIKGVIQPGTGTWYPEDQSPSRLGHLTSYVTERNNIKEQSPSKLGHLTSYVTERNNIKINHRSKNKTQNYKKYFTNI